MGEARNRRLTLVAATNATEPLVVAISRKTSGRLAGLFHKAMGSRSAAQAAAAQADADGGEYLKALAGILDDKGCNVPEEQQARAAFLNRTSVKFLDDQIILEPEKPGVSSPPPKEKPDADNPTH